jgi:hypothetical protein
MGLAGAGRAEEDHVACLGQIGTRGQSGDLGTDRRLVIEVEVLQRLTGTEPGSTDPQVGAGGVTGGDLAFQDGGEVVLVGPAGVTGVVGQPAGGLDDPGCFQRRGQVGDLLDRLGAVGGHHAPTLWSRPNARS